MSYTGPSFVAVPDLSTVWAKSGFSVVAKTTTYAIGAGDFCITGDATGAGFTITLPPATGTGRLLYVAKIDASGNSVTLSRAGSDTISGATTVVLNAQYLGALVIDVANGLWVRIA